MRWILLSISFTLLFSQGRLIDRWHTYDEIQAQLELWDEQFGNTPNPFAGYPDSGIIYHLEEIGRSTQDDIPFWGVRLSYNADVKEDEPRFLFLGQCHAEEIYGVEISMQLIEMFLNPFPVYTQYFQNLRAILQSSEIWIIPTYNPEGLRVVHGYEDEDGEWIEDNAYRKNKRDMNTNGVFDFVEGAGNDSDGVDLNRNFNFNWIFGDSLWELDPGGPNPSYYSHYDYYRGPSPWSETEVQAVRDFGFENDILLSIAFHSSRSGNVSEKVIYSWEWEEGGKYSPDFEMISTQGLNMASLIPKEAGDGFYTPVTSKSRRGNAHDWFYTQTGAIQYLIETGTENLQPDDENLINATVDNLTRGCINLMNRGIGYSPGSELDAPTYRVTGLVSDAGSGAPIQGAWIRFPDMDGPMLLPRITNEFGRYNRLLSPGSFDFEVLARGYETQSFEVIPSSSSLSTQNVELDLLERYNLTIQADFPTAFDDFPYLIINDQFGPDTLSFLDSVISIELPGNTYELQILGEDLFPVFHSVNLSSDQNLEFELKYAGTLFYDDFSSLEQWTVENGNWSANMGLLKSQYGVQYLPENQSIQTSLPLELPVADHYALWVDQSSELEWDYDTAYVALTGDMESTSVSWTDHRWFEHEEYHPLDIPYSENIHLTIGINADETNGYRGLEMDQIAVLYEPAGDCPIGDLDHDGIVTVLDVLVVVENIVNYVPLSGYQTCSGDLSGDEDVDILDIIAMVVWILEDE